MGLRSSLPWWAPFAVSLLLAASAGAQPYCSFSLGNDVTICQGQTTTLHGPPGFGSYLWDTGETTQDITVSTAGNHWCRASYNTGNLIVNGDFSAGNTGFSSQFTYNSNLIPEPTYYVDVDANLHHNNFHATSNGNFLMANAGASHNHYIVWGQTVPLCVGQTYTLSFSGCDISGTSPPHLDWYINGTLSSGPYDAPLGPGVWQTFTRTYTATATSANFSIRVRNPVAGGSDIGLDDISLSTTITLSDTIRVNVNPLPVVALGPDFSLCTGQTQVLNASVHTVATYLWQDGSTLPTYTVSGPGNYSVTVTSNGCSASDAVLVTARSGPTVNLGNDISLCNGGPVLLDATFPGATYLWQDGSTGATFNVTGSGAYGVDVTQNGCTASDAINVTLNSPPVVALGPDVAICTGQSVAFDVTVPGGTYLWENGSTSPTRSVSAAGTYSVTVTANGCSASDAIDVTVNPAPTVTLPADVTLCQGQSLHLDATLAGATYHWQDGSTNATFDVTTAGTFSVDVTLNGCTVSDAIDVGFNAPPTVALGPDVALCAGQSASFDVTVPGGTYLWEDGSTSPTRSVGSAGSYSVTVTANGCSASDAIDVAVNPAPTVALPADVTLCAGQSLHLDATLAGATYLWQDGSTNATFDVTSAGTYSVDVTLNGCTASDAIDVGYLPPNAVNLGPDVTLCAGQSLPLDVTVAGGSYLWENGSTSPTRSITAAGTYSVTVMVNGCTASDAVDVAVNPMPTASLPADVTLCTGQSLHLDATYAGATYFWQDGSTNATFDVTSAGTYSVDVTLNGCTASDAIDVGFNAPPTVALGPNVTICAGQSVPFDVTVPGGTYLWENGSTSPTRSVSATGTYSVTVTTNGCSASDAIDVAVNPAPTVALPADVTLCAGQSLHLDATLAGATYHWQDGSTNSTFDVTSAGTYSVDVTLNGCTASDAIDVGYLPPNAVNLGPDVTLCAGQSLPLDVTVAGGSYLWQDGNTSPTRSITTAGTYSVTVTVNGCNASDAIDVAVNPMPTASLPADATLCQGQSLHLDATYPGATYHWQDGSSAATFDVSTAGHYAVDVTLNGCTASDAIDVAYNPLPAVNLGADNTVCAGTPVQLDATVAGATYLWQDGSTNATIDVTSTGTYSVTVDLNGCTATDSRHVTVDPVPVFDLGSDRVVCPGTSVTLDATVAGATYLWQDGSTNATFTTTSPGSFSVQVTLGQCSSTDQVDVANFNLQSVNLGADVTVCAGSPVPLAVNVAGATYLWNNGSTGNAVNATTSGDWWVEVTLNGCSVRDTAHVTIVPLPVANLGPDLLVCPGGTELLDATTANASYFWSNGSTGATLTAGAGEWNVRITVNGCSDRDTVMIAERMPPSIHLGNDTLLCPQATLALNAGNNNALWTDGLTSNTRTVTAAGTYGVTVTDAFGCTASDAIVVSYAAPIPVALGNDTTICQGSTLVLDATTAGATGYSWNNGEPGSTLSVTGIGTYWVEVFQGQCSVTDTIHVQVVNGPVVQLPHDTTLCPGATLLLNANAGSTPLVWQNGSTVNTFLVNAAGTYWVQLTNANACVSTDTIHVGYLDVSSFSLGNDTTLCSGHDLTLHAELDGGSTVWSTGATGPTLTVSAANTYSATITVGGCSVHDDITVSVTQSPTIDLGQDQYLCAGSDLVLSAANVAGASYLWDNGSTSTQRTVSSGGTYWARITLNGCSERDTVVITSVALPVVDLGNDTTLCLGDTRLTDVTTPNATYYWNDGNTSATRALSAGDWSVSVLVNGCVGTDAIHIAQAPAPVVDLPSDTVLCPGMTWTIDVTQANATYTWQDGASGGSYLADEAGTYAVSVDLNGCAAGDLVNVQYFDPTRVDLGPDTALCPGGTLVLSTPFLGATLLWQDGSGLPTFTVEHAGTYRLLVDANGCTAEDSVHVTMVPLNIPDLGADQSLCAGQSVTLSVDPGAAAVSWSTGATGNEMQVTEPGTYSVTLSMANCISSDAVNVDFAPMTTHVDLGNDTTMCPGQTMDLDASALAGNYTWSTGSHDPTITVTMPGTYHVLIEGPCLHATDTLVIAPGDCLPFVYVPNAFTPDGDGQNDFFAPSVDGDLITYDLMIFDRWGMAVFHSTTPGQTWDGTLNGARVPDDVYVWKLSYKAIGGHGVEQERRLGSVTLLR